jgi:EAL domain-containing protein (putative c-di-GMP-specific phosphodiesterase class I)
MRGWRWNWIGGERASDRKVPAPVLSLRDRPLEEAIHRDRIELRFQPQIEPGSGLVTGVEALARWDAATPEEMFARADAAGLSERLSRAIQRKALRAAAQWHGSLAGLPLSINLLPRDLDRAGYEDWLLGEIAAAGLAPERVTVEIVENSLVAGREVAQRLSALRAAGLRIAIDDFGTGYSSLAYLTTLPIDAIKVDRAMIADIVGGQRDRIVVKAMIGMARELGLKVVVEGVESMAQLQILAEWGCDLYQGFLGAGALDEVELARFVENAHRSAA